MKGLLVLPFIGYNCVMSNNNSPIFITGRFRSGTSFLWQLFNALDGYCAWYEPLHPQLLEAIKYVDPKKDHVGVSDYWQTYRENQRFSQYYSKQFATEHLYLEPQQRHPELKTYINHLIELSQPARAVLQFNRVDCRLAWLKSNFPDALIIHIERNPLQLYESQRKHINPKYRHQADYWDAYELAQWSYALSDEFPFMTLGMASEHAFYRFYLLYQLSKIMARNHADISINLDVDVFQSEGFIKKLNGVVGLSKRQQQTIKDLVHIPELSEFDESQSNQLIEIMTQVDLLLAESGLLELFGQKSMTAIHFLYAAFWNDYKNKYPGALRQLQSVAQKIHDELHRIKHENIQLTNKLAVKSTDFDQLEMKEPQIESKDFTSITSVDSMLNYMSDLSGLMTESLSLNNQLRLECQNHNLPLDE